MIFWIPVIKAKLKPEPFAASFICSPDIFICNSDEATDSMIETKMIIIDGITRLGAKEKICLICKSEAKPVKPSENRKPDSILHKELIELALLDNSPEEKRRKNLAGNDNTLAITAASTEREILEVTLEVIRL